MVGIYLQWSRKVSDIIHYLEMKELVTAHKLLSSMPNLFAVHQNQTQMIIFVKVLGTRVSYA